MAGQPALDEGAVFTTIMSAREFVSSLARPKLFSLLPSLLTLENCSVSPRMAQRAALSRRLFRFATWRSHTWSAPRRTRAQGKVSFHQQRDQGGGLPQDCCSAPHPLFAHAVVGLGRGGVRRRPVRHHDERCTAMRSGQRPTDGSKVFTWPRSFWASCDGRPVGRPCRLQAGCG